MRQVVTRHVADRTDRKKGFTLVELLVVISIIALLLAILMPSLQRAREQAQAVVCQSNLKQWGLMFTLYAADNNGYFHQGRRPYQGNPGVIDPDHIWLNAFRPYYGEKDAVQTCPTAAKSVPNPNTSPPGLTYVGAARIAWERPDYIGSSYSYKTENFGSYGLNGYVCSNQDDYAAPFYKGRYWKKADSKGSYNVPVMLDSSYWKVYPIGLENLGRANAADFITADYIWNNPRYLHDNYMASNAIDRHRGRVNVLFMDGVVNAVGLKGLWSLKWNRDYQDPSSHPRFEWSAWLNETSK